MNFFLLELKSKGFEIEKTKLKTQPTTKPGATTTRLGNLEEASKLTTMV
jgi:hypothetical protein